MKRYFLTVVVLFFSVVIYAQNKNIIVVSPGVVAVGVPFKVEFILNEEPSDFQVPNFKGFEMVAGPTLSTSVSISIINGKRETKSERRYTCVLIALDKGNKTIGEATAIIDGSKIKSRPMPIEVVRESEENNGQSGASNNFAKDDILLLMDVSKTSVYKGEALMATLKLATRVQLAGIESAKYPSFNGFWTQELEIQDNLPWDRENINDKIYDTRIIKRYLLFPQRSGELPIEHLTMDIVAKITVDAPAQRRSIFDDFFGGGSAFQNIKRKIETKEIKINVKELPLNAPLSFDGAVGEFKISSSISSDLLSANSSGNAIITISGNGNLPLISEPKLIFPNSFETYKVKSDDNYSINKDGAIGSKTYEYPFIARASGKYNIPELEFSYFDTKQEKYKSIKASSLSVVVSTDTTSNTDGKETKIFTGVTKEELKILGSDIRYIETNKFEELRKNIFFIGSFSFYMIIFCFILASVGAYLFLSKQRSLNMDIVKVKSSRARKVALNRLKEANIMMTKDQCNEFYQEILRAMWGYVSDKLNIELSLLSKNNISDALLARGVDTASIDNYIFVIEQCEFAQYAPSRNNSMSEVYNNSVDIISNLEDNL